MKTPFPFNRSRKRLARLKHSLAVIDDNQQPANEKWNAKHHRGKWQKLRGDL